MAYEKYQVSDNSVGNLDAGIGASTTSITLSAGNGALFPSGKCILTFVQYVTPADPTSGIAKQERVLQTSRLGDILTVTRGFGGDTPTTFLSGDYVYLLITSDIIEDIQDEVTRLESDKLYADGALRTGLGAYKIIYTDSLGDETEIGLSRSGNVLTSNGASAAPSFQSPAGSITGEIKIWAGSAIPSGFLACDGSAVSRSTYSYLFSAIGTTYGVGDGATTFNVPDLRGNVPVGKDSGTFSTLGGTGGEETHKLTKAELPAHAHDIIVYNGYNTANLVERGSYGPGSSTVSTLSVGSDIPHNNLQPYLTVNYIIKT